MNKLFILIIVLTFNKCSAQENDNRYYKGAYDYLISLPEIGNNGLKISDTIVHIDLINFYEELSEGNDRAMLYKLDSIDNENNNKNYYLQELNNLPSDTNSKYILFFSKIFKDILLAEIFENQGMKNTPYERLRAFNKSWVFLFKFDKNCKICNVYRKKIEYD